MVEKRIIVAITGATGAIYGIKLLEALQSCPDVETHLIISEIAGEIIAMETSYDITAVKELADHHYDARDMAAAIASGSYQVYAMVVIPCTMKTLAAIAHGLADNLITRAADVTLKEKRKLILTPRETPLSLIHLQNMLTAAQAGAVILPPMPAFYNKPAGIDDLVNHLVGRVMDQLGLSHELYRRWHGG